MNTLFYSLDHTQLPKISVSQSIIAIYRSPLKYQFFMVLIVAGFRSKPKILRKKKKIQSSLRFWLSLFDSRLIDFFESIYILQLVFLCF
jgi:hypothetical protein